MSTLQPKRMHEMDILRAAALSLLILHHGGVYRFTVLGLPLSRFRPYMEVFLLGNFLFLAGYFLAHSFFVSAGGSAQRFWIGRITRIYPPYWLALFLFMITLSVDVTPVNFVVHILGLQILLAPKVAAPILTLWFVGLLLLYYAVGVAILKLARRPAMQVLAFGLVFAASLLIRRRWGLLDDRFFVYFMAFVGGVVAGQTRLPKWLFPLRNRLLVFVPAMVASALLYRYVLRLGLDPTNLLYIFSVSFFIFCAMGLAHALATVMVNASLGQSLFAAISEASFFAYLFHRPIWRGLTAIYQPEIEREFAAYLILTGFLVVLPLSFAAQRLYNWVLRRFPTVKPG